jgi:hypothetical protein
MPRAFWLGGPKDGESIFIDEGLLHRPVKVLTGSSTHPMKRYVTPRLSERKQWILPFYEGQIVEETT